MLAHGALLRSNFFSAEEVEAIVSDYRTAGLSALEVAIYAFAQKMTLNAYKITPEDIEGLRSHGLDDREILDLVLAAARNFFSKTLDALGAEPDEVYLKLESHLREALAGGRPFPASS